VVSKALTILERAQNDYQDWLEETRAKVDVAVAELERGEGIDGKTAMAQIRANLLGEV
jgi:antitoxin ParD1/3/4